MTYTEDDDGWILCNSREEFDDFLKDYNEGDDTESALLYDDFTQETGVTFEELKGKKFSVMHSRIYFKEDEK